MEVRTEVLDNLKSIGLNLYERKIYVALLAKGVATAAQLSEIASVPRSRSYDVLESLAEKGFVVVQPSKPIKYVGLKPAEALERTKDAMKKKFDTMMERIDKLRTSPTLTELEGIHKQGLNLIQPTEMTGTLKGSHLISRQFQSIVKGAKKQIDIMTTEKGVNTLHGQHFRTLKKASTKGVKIKILAPVKDSKALKQLSGIAEVRNAKAGARMTVVDGEHLLMALTDDGVHESQDLALWATSSHAVRNMATPLFTQSWKQSK